MLLRSLALALLAAPLALPQANPLPAHETLSYNIEWRLITAGKATLSWNAQPQSQQPWQLKLHLQSAGLVSTLFKVDDDYTANLNQALCTVSSFLTSHEGSRLRETRVLFDYPNHRADYLERDRARNTTLLAAQNEIPNCVHDVIGGLYYLRTLNLEPGPPGQSGQSVQVPVSDGKKAVMARIEAQQREDIRVPSGTFHTIRYEAYLFDNVLFRRSAHLYVWLTDDRRRLPVQIRVKMAITVGTITLELEKHE